MNANNRRAAPMDSQPHRSSYTLLQLGSKTEQRQLGSELALAHVLPSHASGEYQIR